MRVCAGETEEDKQEKKAELWAFLCTLTVVRILLHFPAGHWCLEFPTGAAKTRLFLGSHAALRLDDSNNNLQLWKPGSLKTTENPKHSYFGFPSAASRAEAAIRSLKISVLIPGSVPFFYTCTHSASTCAASAPVWTKCWHVHNILHMSH